MNAHDRLPVLLKDLEDRTQSFAKLLPGNVNPARFISAAKTALLNNPRLVACERRSVILACTKCALDGVVPDGREAVILDGYGKAGPAAQYWLMTGGMLTIAYRSGRVLKIEARIVYEGDAFDLEYGTEARVRHHPAFKERGEIVGAYAFAVLVGGQILIEYMDRGEIEGIRKRSKNPKGPWESDFAEMARKTTIRRLFKSLPKAPFSADAEDGEMPAHPDAELLINPSQAGRPFRAEAPEGELVPEEVAQAEQLADIDDGPAPVDESRREESHSGTTVPEWKQRLRELRVRLTMCATTGEVEETWRLWDKDYHPPAEVTERAKQLVDERLAALSYQGTKNG